jgi:long-chain acyl-CoA synthetase
MASEIAEAFARLALDRHTRIAVHGLGDLPTRTFADLAADAEAMTRALAETMLPSAPCIVAAIGNDPALFAVLLAVLGGGGALALFDAPDRLDSVQAAAAQLAADAVIVPVSAGLPGPGLPGGLTLATVTAAAMPAWRHDPASGPRVLKITSGSTDVPRAVVVTEAQLLADVRHIVEAMEIGPDDVNLAVIPLAHSYGLGNLVLPLLVQGSPIAIRDRFAPRQLHADVAAAGVTVLPGVPYMFEHVRRLAAGAALAPVRRLITAGAPIALETVAYFKRETGRNVHSFYGTSETGGICFDAGDEVGGHVTVGRPLPGVEVVLRDVDGGDVGRVFVRSDAVAVGYAAADAADERAAFVDGGFLTGDLARRDGDRLILAGRVSSFINVAGRKVDPAEVEGVLRRAPGVLEAHVFGVACDRRGEQVVACVRRGRQGPAAELRSFCAERLAAYKVPREIVEVDAVPRDARGKVSRRALEALLADARARGASSAGAGG